MPCNIHDSTAASPCPCVRSGTPAVKGTVIACSQENFNKDTWLKGGGKRTVTGIDNNDIYLYHPTWINVCVCACISMEGSPRLFLFLPQFCMAGLDISERKLIR